ncbi:MAG TPA: PIN domain-containing protein [Chthonomonadaceae bacterium]|nr:PIN domain-containing protein [Chthonomonadaceae bacterium]
MRLLNFRTLFTLILCLLLGGLGYWLGSQLPHMPGFWWFPSGQDLIANHSGYETQVAVMLCVVGVLLGVWSGPRIGDQIIQAGKTLERSSPTDKIAVGVGVALGIVVTLPFYQLSSQLSQIPTFFKIVLLVLINVILIYLGIVAMMSMKNELVTILSRGGPVTPPKEAEDTHPMANCKILDTNVIIDGRIADICRTGFVEGPLYVPGFVLEELQHIADSGDGLKRARGRRGLDILNGMQKELPLIVRSWDKALDRAAMDDEVDTRLVKLAKALKGTIVTNDFNLNKVAALQGVQVLNVNELANAVKPVVLPGEAMMVGIVKEGKEPNQGVAYLDDGTMIVVEDGRRYLNSTLSVIVTSVLQTVAGKMIFARVRSDDEGDGFDTNGGRGSRDGGNGHGPDPSGGGYPRRGTGKKIR